MDYINIILFFFAVVGMYAAYKYGRKTKKFKFNEYLFLIAPPVICCLSLVFVYGVNIFYFFILSAVVGFVLEYLTGFLYFKTLNSKLWTYGKYNVGGFTSLLTFPMWGVAGIVFWLLSQRLGL